MAEGLYYLSQILIASINPLTNRANHTLQILIQIVTQVQPTLEVGYITGLQSDLHEPGLV